MSTILVVDDMALCREPIAEALRHHGHEVTCADGGESALDILRDRKPDLVLLDVTMPDPDGLAVLAIIRRNPDFKDIPVILLTDCAQQETVTKAVKCGVQGYLLKSNFSLDMLLTRVDSCIGKDNSAQVSESNLESNSSQRASLEHHSSTVATALPSTATQTSTAVAIHPLTEDAATTVNPVKLLNDLKPIVTKSHLTKLVNDGLELKPLAASVHNVMAVTASTGCCAADVAKAVTNDQALCIRLLKLANSSAYSRGHPVDSVQTAVQRIGIQEVRKLVMTLGVFDQYVGKVSTRIDMRMFWEHSIACGLIAAALARECRFKAADECFLWGTLHDVGRVILLDHVPNEYNQVCETADALTLPLEVVESKLLLLDHCEILKHALEHWQFPHTFIVPVVNHHESVNSLKRLGPEHTQAAMIVALANRIVQSLLLGCSGNEMIYPFDDLVETLGISSSAIDKIATTIPDEARDLKFTMLAHSTSDTWPDFRTQVCARLETKVRPICASKEPSTDAFKLFLDCVGEHCDTEPPNIGVIYLRDVREAMDVFSDYQSRETEADCGPLPLIVVCAKGAAKLGDDAPWKTRPHTVLKTPVSIEVLLKTMKAVLPQAVES